MSKRNHIVERASDVNGGQYIQTNPSYNSGYEDGKKAGKEYCAAELAALREQVKELKAELTSIDGALDDPRANLTLTTSEIIWELKEHIVALTKEREKLKTVPMKYRRMQFNAELQEDVRQLEQEDVRQLEQQLAALAEQNKQMRKVLLRLACLGNGDQYGNSIGNCIAQEALSLSLPDLASPVLNRIRAEALNKAAKWFNDNVDNRTDTWQAQELRRMAAELEKANG